MSASNWTDVNDCLPCKDVPRLVLVCIPKQYQSQPDILIGYYDQYREEWRNNFGTLDGVTHWQPLPEPPRGNVSNDAFLDALA